MTEETKTATISNSALSGGLCWLDPKNIPDDIDDQVLVLCKEREGIEWQYVCWPPDGENGWLLCQPTCKQNVDIDLDKLDNIEVVGWKKI